jgi:alkylation response protein AidB-like acyl-CoA dehydrogenase
VIANELQDEIDAALGEAAERFGRDRYPLATRVHLSAAQRRFDGANWQAMAHMGWLGIASAEEDGGLGLRVGSVAALARVSGRWTMNEPFISTGVIAADVIRLHASAGQRSDWVPALLEGRLRAACAFSQGAAAVTERHGRLDGRCDVVPDADIADLLLVEVEGAAPPRWFAVDARAAGLTRTTHPLVDGRGAASLRFDACEAQPLPGVHSGHPALLGAVAVVADSVGAMEAALALTLEHVKTRRQFGVTIGSHQVVSHRAVEMYIRLQESRAMLAAAVSALQAGSNDTARDVHAAKAFVGRQARLLAQDAVQLHGGLGMSEDCGASHCLRRTLVNEQLHGTTAQHLQRFMAERKDTR